jgi:hypothetical protein
MGTAAVLVLVGPASDDVARLADLVDSLDIYEPDLLYVLVDDARGGRSLEPALGPRPRRVVVLPHPRGQDETPLNGALITGVLAGLDWLRGVPDLEFVLKIDLDGLAIAPFRTRINGFLRSHPDAGTIGCRGETCNRAHRLFLNCLRRPSPFAVALEVLDAVSHEASPDAFPRRVAHPAAGTIEVTAEEYAALAALRPVLSRAVANGHHCSDYCQGGAYAMSSVLVRRMEAAGYFEPVAAWLPLASFGEDEVMAMYSYATGLRVYDFSDEGEPFGVSHSRLPFEPECLFQRGHALIHSLLRGRRYDETALRTFFRQRRAGSRPRPIGETPIIIS